MSRFILSSLAFLHSVNEYLWDGESGSQILHVAIMLSLSRLCANEPGSMSQAAVCYGIAFQIFLYFLAWHNLKYGVVQHERGFKIHLSAVILN